MQLDDEDVKSYQKRRLYDFELTKHESVNGTTIFIAVLAAIITAWFLHESPR